MKKIFLLLFFFSFNSVVSADTPELTKISYTGSLTEETSIFVEGINLENCVSGVANNISFSLTEITPSSARFGFQKNMGSRGEVQFICEQRKYSLSYNFPMITKITGSNKEKFDGMITITGQGLEGGTIVLEGDSFSTISADDRTIVGKIGKNITSPFFSVRNTSGLVSNTMVLDLEVPKILKVTTPTFFKKGEKMILEGENFSLNNTIIKIGNKEVKPTSLSKNLIEIIIPEIDGNQSVQVESNGYILSNGVNISFLSERPFISEIKEKDEIEGTNSSKMTYIYGKNFSQNGTTQVFINGKNVAIYEKGSDSLLVLKNYNFDIGNNFIEVKSNGLASQVVNLEKPDSRLPSIGGINSNYATDTQKFLSVYIDNYDPKTDIIYFNKQGISPESCLNNSCVVSIAKSTLYGEFSVGRKNYISPQTVIYDVRTQEVPHISYIKFIKTVGDSVYFEIYGHNLVNSTYNGNLFSSDEKGSPDIRKGTDFLLGYTPTGLSAESELNFGVGGNNYSSTLKFQAKDMGQGATIAGPAVLYELQAIGNSKMVQVGSKVELIGKNFSAGESVMIGDTKVNLYISKSQTYPYFIVPEINAGTYKISLINSQNQQSNQIDLIVSEKTTSKNIIFEGSQSGSGNYFIDDTQSKSQILYNILVHNKHEKIFVQNLTYKINVPKKTNIGTFHLNLNGVRVSEVEEIQSDGTLVFGGFYIDVNNSPQTLSLYKNSDYIEAFTGDISVVNEKTVLQKIDKTIFSQTEYKNITNKKINISKKALDNCISGSTTKNNCIEEEIISEETPKTETQNTIPELEKPSSANIVLRSYSLSSKSFLTFEKQLKNLAKKIDANIKYDSKKSSIQSTMNNILQSLSDYEKAGKKSASKKLALMKLKYNMKELKKSLQ